MEHEDVAADLIAQSRRRSGLSQAELARRAGMARSVVNSYEHGRRQPGVDALARIAAAAGLELRVAPAVRRLDDERSGRVLAQVLDLAEALPHRRRGRLTYPAAAPSGRMSNLAERLVAIHDSLTAAKVPHAFGGAIALAYCTEEPRGTRDIDVNLFVGAATAPGVLAELPEGVTIRPVEVHAAERDGQVRVWWDDTPLDLFFAVHEFHRDVAANVRLVPFVGREIPVIDCVAVVVFKALFNRTRDWADIEAVGEAGTIDREAALGWVERLVGSDDPIATRLAEVL